MILAAAIVAASATTAVAADNNSYAPEAGEFSAEIQFNPFSNNFNTFKIDQLKGRYFFTNKDAIRFGIGFGVNTEKKVSDPDNNEDTWSKDRTGSFSIDLGYERNLLNYKRVNLYAGAGLGFALQRTCTTKQVDQNDEIFVTKLYNNNSWNEFNVKVFTGIDFFIYKGLFVGAELGIKVGCKNFLGSYTKGGVDSETGKWDEGLESDHGPKSNSFVLATYAEPALRLGWQF